MSISIIMPCHNSASTIREAIESVIWQTNEHWELIIINDGSTDNTPDIIEEFASRDNRINIINLSEKLGVSSARNMGIESSHSKYIGFLDSDDTLERNFVERMLGTVQKYDCDVVLCQYKVLNERDHDIKLIDNKLPKDVLMDNNRVLRSFFNSTPGIGALWNKIYSRDYIERKKPLRFNPGRRRAEDWEFNLMLFQKKGSLVAICDFLYNYNRNVEISAMKIFDENDLPLMFRSIDLLLDCNDRSGLGYSSEDILKNSSFPIFEHLFQSVKTTSYLTYKQKLEDRRFKELLEKADLSILPICYKLPAYLIKLNLLKIAFLLSKALGRLTLTLQYKNK